jgi:probable addiction module antidote protein
MSEKLGKFPTGPRSRESADYLNHAFETSDIAEICKAIGVVTHRHNVSDIAKKAGIQRSSLYRAFVGSPKHPNFMTVQGVLDALGFQLHVTARGHECDASAPGNRFQSASINNEQHTITLTVLESAQGLGRVKKAETGSVSGHDRSRQRLGPDDVHDPRQIISQDRECHLGGYFWKRFGEEVCRYHAGLHRSEGMLDCFSTLAHGLWVCIEALLHSFEHAHYESCAIILRGEHHYELISLEFGPNTRPRPVFGCG